MTINFSLKWYDLWIGIYIDRPHHTIYFCPLPMFLFTIRYNNSQ